MAVVVCGVVVLILLVIIYQTHQIVDPELEQCNSQVVHTPGQGGGGRLISLITK